MTRIIMGSRRGEQIENIDVGEEMTRCGHCGGRTGIAIQNDDGSREETCLGCGQRYHVEDETFVECQQIAATLETKRNPAGANHPNFGTF